MKESRKHHYIPRFYLKGFTNENNQFFVYDKKENKMWQSNPENSFLENHRNTGVIEHFITKEISTSDIPETTLAYFDDRSAKVIEEIRKSTHEDHVLIPERIHALRFFIISTFWRIPANDNLREDVIKNFSFEELGFGFYDKEGNRNEGLEKLLKEIDLWNKMYTTLLPISTVTKKYNKTNIDEWKLFYRENDFHLVSDNPIIIKNYIDFSSLQQELIIPLSSKRLLVITKKISPKVIDPVFSLKIDVLLFRKAFRYVASSDKNYLKLISEEANKFPNITDDKLFDNIFGHFN